MFEGASAVRGDPLRDAEVFPRGFARSFGGYFFPASYLLSAEEAPRERDDESDLDDKAEERFYGGDSTLPIV
jgi:hypothetical protein